MNTTGQRPNIDVRVEARSLILPWISDNMKKSRMYAEAKSLNFFIGCEFECDYCKPSFQKLVKWSMGKRCSKCATYTPHPHLERLDKPPPKVAPDGFIFFPSCSDWWFIDYKSGTRAIQYIADHPEVDFLIQSKCPYVFQLYSYFPPNTILGTTIETNRMTTLPISRAPTTVTRFMDFTKLKGQVSTNRKMLTIEPIMDFDPDTLYEWVHEIQPWRIYIGYNSRPKEVKLPEPSLAKTLELAGHLEADGFDVRTKLLREAIK